jgi:hypothetical protein
MRRGVKSGRGKPTNGQKFGILPCYPCATVSFRSIQDSELSHHGTDTILLASEELFIQEKIYEEEVE